jgi:hypothetical protein
MTKKDKAESELLHSFRVASIVFKDLRKPVSHSQHESTSKELFETLQCKPFQFW